MEALNQTFAERVFGCDDLDSASDQCRPMKAQTAAVSGTGDFTKTL